MTNYDYYNFCLVFAYFWLSVSSEPIFQGPFQIPGSIAYGCPSLNGIALTFDDGPTAQTEQLLDVLQEFKLSATFFVVGVNAQTYPALIRRMLNEGHVIGSHTWNHTDMAWLFDDHNTEEIDRQLLETESILESLIGTRPWLFRPPYGSLNVGLKELLVKRGYTIVMWNGGCTDWFYQENFGTVIEGIDKGMGESGGIVCFHDTVEATVENIRDFLERYKDSIIDMPLCLKDANKSFKQTLPSVTRPDTLKTVKQDRK